MENLIAAILVFFGQPMVLLALAFSLIAVEGLVIRRQGIAIRFLESKILVLTGTAKAKAGTISELREHNIQSKWRKALADLEAIDKGNSPRAIALRRRLGLAPPDEAQAA